MCNNDLPNANDPTQMIDLDFTLYAEKKIFILKKGEKKRRGCI